MRELEAINREGERGSLEARIIQAVSELSDSATPDGRKREIVYVREIIEKMGIRLQDDKKRLSTSQKIGRKLKVLGLQTIHLRHGNAVRVSGNEKLVELERRYLAKDSDEKGEVPETSQASPPLSIDSEACHFQNFTRTSPISVTPKECGSGAASLPEVQVPSLIARGAARETHPGDTQSPPEKPEPRHNVPLQGMERQAMLILGDLQPMNLNALEYVRRHTMSSLKAIDPAYDEATLKKIVDDALRDKGWGCFLW